MLDPYTNQELVKSVAGKDCGVLPSRRSWECISETIKNGDNENAWEGSDGIALLTEICDGVIETGAAIEFVSHFKAQGNALSPKMLMEAASIDAKTVAAIKKLCKTDFPAATKLVDGCTLYLKENVETLSKPEGAQLAHNFHNFHDILAAMTKDAQIAAVKDCVISAVKN